MYMPLALYSNLYAPIIIICSFFFQFEAENAALAHMNPYLLEGFGKFK